MHPSTRVKPSPSSLLEFVSSSGSTQQAQPFSFCLHLHSLQSQMRCVKDRHNPHLTCKWLQSTSTLLGGYSCLHSIYMKVVYPFEKSSAMHNLGFSARSFPTSTPLICPNQYASFMASCISSRGILFNMNDVGILNVLGCLGWIQHPLVHHTCTKVKFMWWVHQKFCKNIWIPRLMWGRRIPSQQFVSSLCHHLPTLQ